MKIVVTERWREVFRFIRDVGLAVLGILGPVATVWALWIPLGVWALVMALGLALIVTFWFYFWKRIRTVPYLKEEGEAAREATELLKATKDSVYYYGGVGFIGQPGSEWREEYTEKLNSKTFIKRFLDVESREDMLKLLEGALGKEAKNVCKTYEHWVKTHCKHLQERVAHNDFYDFEGAPIWRYGLHCIVFDEKHVAMPFASGKTSSALFLRNCPEIAKALTLCLDGLIDDFGLERVTGKQLAEKVGLPRSAGNQ